MDYYAVLGIARDAEDVVIAAACKAMVKKYHPVAPTQFQHKHKLFCEAGYPDHRCD